MRKLTITLIMLWLAVLLMPSYGAGAPKTVPLSKVYEMALKNSKALVQLEIDQGLAIKKRNELALKIELESTKPEVDLNWMRVELAGQNTALEANERYYRAQKEILWTQVNSLYMQLLREGLSEQLERERFLSQTLLLPKTYNDYLSGYQTKEGYTAAKEELQGTKNRLDLALAAQVDLWKRLNVLTGQNMTKDSTLVMNPNLYKFDAPTASKLSASVLKADYELYLAEEALKTALSDLNHLMNAYQSSYGYDAAFMTTFERQSPVDYNVLFPLYKEFLAKMEGRPAAEPPFVLPEIFINSEYPLIDGLVAREKARDRVNIAKTQVSLNLDLAVNQYNLKVKDYELSLKALVLAEAEYKQLETALMIGKISSSQMAAATTKKRNLRYDKDLKYLELYEASARLAKLTGQF